MINHIVYHADIDGTICAAMFLRFKLKPTDSYRLHPVSSSLRGDKFQKMISDMKLNTDDKLYVFDFEYHKRANLWVDHHPNSKFGSHKVVNANMRYFPFADSAAALLFEELRGDISDQKNMHGIVDLVNMIDSAKYPDVNYIFNETVPIMIMRAILEQTPPMVTSVFCRMVEVIANSDFNLSEATSRLDIDKREINKLRAKAGDAKKHMTVHNSISVIRQRRVAEFPRYSECFLKPDVRYNVRITSLHKKQLIQIGYNRWHKQPNDLNIGKFLADLDYVSGGGHFHVGGGTTENENIEKFLDDLSLVTKNEEEPTVEKYGVDKEDQVEKAATEMVKEGKAKDLDEAREKTSTEEGDADGGNLGSAGDGGTEGSNADSGETDSGSDVGVSEKEHAETT